MGSDESQDSVHKPQPFWRERRAEAVSNRSPSAYQPKKDNTEHLNTDSYWKLRGLDGLHI